ncbi:uncharacterized protein LOC106710265 [Papilio machaon]|uniref:uncharacterized protein LOC106710265 n=1 Tax=Papilio machaon TaxID=76193 RepID=UPI001E662F9B|nr:uncharacterized protein LOC106710265 [Papilio machaon]
MSIPAEDTMHSIKFFLLLAVIISSEAQRPFYAGSSAIGYPETKPNSLLLNRFGENEGPLEARAIKFFLIFALFVAPSLCQRPAYAGSRPIGYPALEETTEAPTSAIVDSKMGSEITTMATTPRTTTVRLPIEAMGDRRLVEYLLKLPLDKQPFWLINWQKLEDNRTKPKTYPLKPNSYLHHIPTSRPQPTRFSYQPRSFQLYYK